jgi:DNA helicase-2/ATP-dependent DNA helicase PcrA
VARENKDRASWTRYERDLLAGCDPEQIDAITTLASPLCVLAGAGSGKTRVLTRRIAWRVNHGSASAAHVLALTFTRKAAGELRTRLSGLGLPENVTAGTFHAVALAELKRLAAERGQRPPNVLSSKIRLLLEVLPGPSERGPAAGRRKGRPTRPADWNGPSRQVRELAQEIEWAKARCLTPAALPHALVAADRQGAWEPHEVSEIWEQYEEAKRRRGVLDFEDLLARCAEEMRWDHEFAASARWRYRHLFVDEYQDVNPAQQRLLHAWLGPNEDLCVVGDPHQAIYGWNGANPRAIEEFPADFPGASLRELSTNYRSTREVLTIAGAVLGGSSTIVAGGSCPEGPLPTVTSYEDDAGEARGVARQARLARRPGRSWSQIAVLARTNAQLTLIESALKAAGVPCKLASAAGLLKRPAVQPALRDASLANGPAALSSWANDLLLTPGEDVGGAKTDSEAEQDLEQLARLAFEFIGEDVRATGTSFRNWLDAVWKRDDEPGLRDAVQLTTFHRAKGLEWAVVFLVGLEDGYVPITHARDPDALAEERRLLYVACTRAEEELHCSWAAARSFGPSQRVPRSPSPWLAAIEAAHRDLVRAQRSSSRTAREGLVDSRKALGLG